VIDGQRTVTAPRVGLQQVNEGHLPAAPRQSTLLVSVDDGAPAVKQENIETLLVNPVRCNDEACVMSGTRSLAT